MVPKIAKRPEKTGPSNTINDKEMSRMSHGVIIESEEEKGRHAYGGEVGVT